MLALAHSLFVLVPFFHDLRAIKNFIFVQWHYHERGLRLIHSMRLFILTFPVPEKPPEFRRFLSTVRVRVTQYPEMHRRYGHHRATVVDERRQSARFDLLFPATPLRETPTRSRDLLPGRSFSDSLSMSCLSFCSCL